MMNDFPPSSVRQKLPASVNITLSTPEEAIEAVRSGDRVFAGTACATPRTLLARLEGTDRRLSDIQIFHFLTDGAIELDPEGRPATRFQHKVFFVGTDTREAVKSGKADYIPISISHIPNLFRTGRFPIDVAFVQVSLPDAHGYVSLGVSVDITAAAVFCAKKVVAEINPNMPRTYGETTIHVSRIDVFVWVDTPIIEYVHPPADEVAQKIAQYVARIIDDGSTLQIGLGRIPNEMLKYLTNRRDLGIHSDVITDPVIDLIEKGVITGNAKTLHPGKIVTSFCMGTQRLYNLIDNNPLFSFHPIDYVSDPSVISRNHEMVSVTQAFALDLMGQVCSDQFEGEFYSGVSSQPEFLRGAAISKRGKAIICLDSTTEDGKDSRIRPLLREGEGVTIPRSDVHYVITEYGIAYLFGKTIREKALALIEIAHPSFRTHLLEEAKRLGYVRRDQILKSMKAYPAEEEREVALKNGTVVLIRPSNASDVEGLQDIFYHLTPKDIQTRFFTRLSSLPVSKAEHLCNVDYENEMAFVAVAGEREKEEVVGSSCYSVDPAANMAEVAYMVRPDYQGLGLGKALQQRMVEYARSKGLIGFTADILEENHTMLSLINEAGKVSMKKVFDEYRITVLF
ncbi:MAG: GNAT family N-acetyltransferase [Desulfobacterales bacterium]